MPLLAGRRLEGGGGDAGSREGLGHGNKGGRAGLCNHVLNLTITANVFENLAGLGPFEALCLAPPLVGALGELT